MQFREQEMIEITAAVSDLALELELPRRADQPESGCLQQFSAEASRP
jgi:hypothetical protein